jgi:hypothetical protein
MPYSVKSVGKGKVKVVSPHGTKAKSTTPEKAKRQVNLLRAVEHNPNWKPTGAPAKDVRSKLHKAVMKKY